MNFHTCTELALILLKPNLRSGLVLPVMYIHNSDVRQHMATDVLATPRVTYGSESCKHAIILIEDL